MRYITVQLYSILIILLLLSLKTSSLKAEVIDKIVASVADNIITLYDIESYAPAVVKNINSKPDAERMELWAEYYKTTLDYLIDINTLQVAAARVGVFITSSEVDDLIVTLSKENSLFRQQLQEIIDREGVITPEIKLFVTQYLIQVKLKPLIQNRAIFTNIDISKYIKENYNITLEQELYDLELVFFPDNVSYKNFINYINAKTPIKNAFDLSGASVVNMGWVTKNQLIDTVADAIIRLKPGSYSDPIVDEDGRYLVAYLLDKKLGVDIPKELSDAASEALFTKYFTDVYNNWLERSKQTIVVMRFD